MSWTQPELDNVQSILQENEALKARVAELEVQRVKPFRVLANTELARGLVTLANRVGMPHRYDPKYKDVVFGCEDGWNWGEDYE